jgi:vitamin B12 transporter
MTRRLFPCCCTLAAIASPLAAQGRDTVRLDPIVVTAARLPAAAASVAGAVTVIEGDDLARAGITTVADALGLATGAALARSGSYGAVTSLFVRGGESDYVRVLVDGVPINAPGGAVDLGALATTGVERIELVRGPGSVLYGSDAVTGVLQIFTRRGGGPRASVAVRGGRYGSSDAVAELGAGTSALGVRLAASQSSTDGTYAFNSGFRNTTVTAGAHWTPDARTDLAISARFGSGRFHYPTDGAGHAVDSNQVSAARLTTVSLEAGRYVTTRLEARLQLGASEARAASDNAPDGPADTIGVYAYHGSDLVQRRTADMRLQLHLARSGVLTLGGAWDWEREAAAGSYLSSFGAGSDASDTTRTSRAAYAQLLASPVSRVHVQAGVRVDRNGSFGSFATARFGLVADVGPATRLRASLGTAFKEPAFSQDFSTAYTVGNPALRPERSRSWEVGLERGVLGGKGSLTVTYYRQHFRDMIQYTFTPPSAGGSNYYNIAGADASGLELEAHLLPGHAWRLSAGLAVAHSSAADSGYDGATFAPGRPLVRRPGRSGWLDVEVVPDGRLAWGARVSYVGGREDLDFSTFPASRVSLAPYARVDAWASLDVVRGTSGAAVAFTARLENATAAVYEPVLGFPAPGRVLWAGVRMTAP